MMNPLSIGSCALALALALPLAATAGPQDRGRSAPAPQSRPAPPPAPRAAAPSNPGGFNFNRDIAPPRPAAPAMPQRTVAAPRTNEAPQRTIGVPQQRTPVGQPNRSQGATNVRPAPNDHRVGGPYVGRFHGPVIRNGHAPGGQYGWNHGVAWQPAPIYWGGGFWGPWALASIGDAVLFGSIIDAQDQEIYQSYQVESDTPGAELLQDYSLQQTACGPANLVQIWGPNNSVICAFPNDAVGPGNYAVDPATFTLVSTGS